MLERTGVVPLYESAKSGWGEARNDTHPLSCSGPTPSHCPYTLAPILDPISRCEPVTTASLAHARWVSLTAWPDLGLGKLSFCPGASTYVLSHFIVWYSRVGWASTVPLLKAAQGPPHVLNPALTYRFY